MNLSLSEAKDLISYLRDQGVSEFEGFGVKFTFRADREINPFSIQDAEERKKAVLESFKKSASEDEQDLLWSAN